jgi:non-ribosomal peptide synthetase component F
MNTVQELFLEVSEEHSARPAIITSEGRTLTYRELSTAVARLTIQLEQCGVQPGDRVGLLLPNGPGFVTACFAILCAGGIAVPMNERYVTSELVYFLEVWTSAFWSPRVPMKTAARCGFAEPVALIHEDLSVSSASPQRRFAIYPGTRRGRPRTVPVFLGLHRPPQASRPQSPQPSLRARQPP